MNEAERRFFRVKESGKPDPWFDAEPKRQSDLAAMDRIWNDLDAMPDLSGMVTDRRPSRRSFLWGGAGLALAASVGAVALLPGGDLTTGLGELQAASLPDGSEILLDAASRLDLDFDDGKRLARLREGRARFRIAPGPAPFTIAASPGQVTLSGGEVNVHLWDGEMTVGCISGDTRLTTTDGSSFVIAAGAEVTVGASGTQPLVDMDQDEAQWTTGRLIFKNRPLRQVVADLDRHRRGTILLRGDGIGNLRVTGVFDAKRPDVALDAVVVALSLNRRDLGPVTLLSPA